MEFVSRLFLFVLTAILSVCTGEDEQCHGNGEGCGKCAAAREASEEDQNQGAIEQAPAPPPHVVVDTQLYDLLGVDPYATLPEIRKAFRKMSLKLHPDKNRDDPDAEEKYRVILEAYEILSNPERRKLYDAEGLNAERVAEWMNILRKNGPAHALAQLHRAWKHLVHARWRPPCLSEAIYGFTQHEACKEMEDKTEEEVIAKGKFHGLHGVLGVKGNANASGRIAARWECEDKRVLDEFHVMNDNMEHKGIEKSDGHRLSHYSVMTSLRQAVQNLTTLEKDRWTTATTPSVSYALHLAGLGCVRCAGPLPVTFLEVGSGMGVSMALTLLTMDMSGGQVGKIVSVDDYSSYDDVPDDQREECRELHERLNGAWSNHILEPDDRIPEGCGKAWKNAAKLLYASMKMPVEMVNAPNLESLGWEELQKRRWLRTFSAVVVRLGGNRTMENVLSDIMLASELLRHQGILILEDWFDDIFDTNVPGLYTSNGVPVTLGGCLDNTFLPWYVNWKLKFYIFQRRPEAELEGNPFLDGGQSGDDDGEVGYPLRPDGTTGEMGWRMSPW